MCSDGPTWTNSSKYQIQVIQKKLWVFMYPNVKKLISVGKNGGIALKTVNLKTLSILPAPITESFPVKST